MDSNHRSPARKGRFLLRKANCGTEREQPKRVVSYTVPMVRMHLPPARSLRTISSEAGKRSKLRRGYGGMAAFAEAMVRIRVPPALSHPRTGPAASGFRVRGVRLRDWRAERWGTTRRYRGRPDLMPK